MTSAYSAENKKPFIDLEFLFKKYVLGQHGGWRYKRNYERGVRKVVKRVHGRLFVDIGAHKLYYSNLLAPNFDSVISFEPNRNLNPIGEYTNIELSRLALSDHIGQETFYCYNNGGADSLIKDFDYHVSGRNYEKDQHGKFDSIIDAFPVNVTTYDQAIGRVADLVKIDVEGSEFEVLNGMSQYPPRKIIVELHDENRENRLLEMMREKGYTSSQIDSNHWLFSLKGC